MSDLLVKFFYSLLAVFIVSTGPVLGTASAKAGTSFSSVVENVFFYALNGEGKSVLLKVIPMDDLETLGHGQLSGVASGEDTGRDYDISFIDDLPAACSCKAKGFTVPELVDYIKHVTSVSGVDQLAFTGNDTIRLMATDSYGTFSSSSTYDELYGIERYYFEGLYDPDTGWKPDWVIDTSDESGVDLGTYYSEYKDNDPYYDDKCAVFATGTPTTPILATESGSSMTSGMLDDSRSLRLLVPMTEADLILSRSTASQNLECIYNMRLDMSSRPSIVSQGTVAHPQAELSLKDDTMTITMSCATPDASMYYSFDGAPQISYTGPVSINVAGRDLTTDPVAFYMTAVREGWDDAGIISVSCPESSGLKMVSEEGNLGYTANTLTIQVGYFGGPYYVKHVFSLDELESLDVIQADYTFIDNMPSVVIDHVEGVRLSDIMDRAGIDLGSVKTFYFWTKDVSSNYFTSFPKTELIDTPRYCYYSLPENFDYDEGMSNQYAGSEGQLVDTVIALADDWDRCLAGATFGSDYQDLNINTRFRLIYGQKDTYTRTASRSAKWIHAIVVELGGAPTVTIDVPSVLDLEVGSLFRTEASIKTADNAISENAEIEWSSGNEDVVSVDSNGNITVHSEGTAVITASFMGSTASFIVNGTAEGASAESGITEIIPQNPMDPGNEYYIQQSEVSSQGDAGGVQNWRMYEMSESAVELPEIKQHNSTVPVIAGVTFCLFIGGIVYRTLKYKFDLGSGLYVFRNKSE